MPNKSQRKGRRAEIELAELLNSYGYNVRPGTPLNFGKEPDLSGLQGVHIECKRVERLNLIEALKQSKSDSERFDDGVPIVVHRRNRQPWIVSMSLTDWLGLYESANEAKKT